MIVLGLESETVRMSPSVSSVTDCWVVGAWIRTIKAPVAMNGTSHNHPTGVRVGCKLQDWSRNRTKLHQIWTSDLPSLKLYSSIALGMAQSTTHDQNVGAVIGHHIEAEILEVSVQVSGASGSLGTGTRGPRKPWTDDDNTRFGLPFRCSQPRRHPRGPQTSFLAPRASLSR